jgi:hypothetical protein
VVSAAIAPALASSSVRASRTVSFSPRGLAIMPEVVKPVRLPISVAASNASPLLQHEVGVARVPPHQEIAAVAAKQAPRAKSVVMATSQAPFPTILSPTHTSIVAGLLAPVRLVTRSASLVATPPTARASVLTGAQPTAAGSTAMLSAGSRLGNTMQQVPTANAAPRAVNIASVINGAAPASASITPGNISLATLTMRPGPRTTVLTSDIKDEMRRPASAWAYAEALPSELLGRESAARHSDSLEPSLQSQITEASAARLKVAENEGLTSATRTSVTAPLLEAGEAVRAAPVRVIAVRAAPAAQDVLTARTHNPPAPNTKMVPQAAVAEPLASLVRTVAGQANPGASVTAKQMALAAPGQHSNLAPASGEYRKKQSVDTALANADLSLSAPKYALTSSPRVSAKTDSPGGGVYGAGISEKACSAALVGDAPSPDVCGGIRLLDQIPRPAL